MYDGLCLVSRGQFAVPNELSRVGRLLITLECRAVVNHDASVSLDHCVPTNLCIAQAFRGYRNRRFLTGQL